jgi:hypothetical protein
VEDDAEEENPKKAKTKVAEKVSDEASVVTG